MCIRSKRNFYLPIGFCHLVFALFFVISNSYVFAQKKNVIKNEKVEIKFLTGILEQVTPGKKFNKESKLPLNSFELFKKVNENLQVWVSYWQYESYRYPLFIQEFNGEIEDFFLTFPSFLLHDKIHEQLISLWGKQQFYQKSNLSALYSWKGINQNTLSSVYEANCSITCFPVSLSMQKNKLNTGVIPLWQQFHLHGAPKTKNKSKASN